MDATKAGSQLLLRKIGERASQRMKSNNRFDSFAGWPRLRRDGELAGWRVIV
jgi:hypothetical protein